MSAINFVKFDKYEHPYIQVPLDAPQLQFFIKMYGNDKQEMDGSINGPFPGLIDMVCEKKPYRKYKLRKRVPGKKLTVLIPSRLKHSKVEENSVLILAKTLENFFREFFVSYVEGAVSCGSSESNAVQTFLDKYEISVDDWEFNAARMVYRRAKGYEK
jgi:hypothetical protein